MHSTKTSSPLFPKLFERQTAVIYSGCLPWRSSGAIHFQPPSLLPLLRGGSIAKHDPYGQNDECNCQQAQQNKTRIEIHYRSALGSGLLEYVFPVL